MSGSLMSHNFKTIGFTVIFTTNIFVPAISDNTFVSAIIHNTFATIPLSTIPYTGVPLETCFAYAFCTHSQPTNLAREDIHLNPLCGDDEVNAFTHT